MKKIAVLSCSGGLDSSTMILHFLANGYKKLSLLAFNYSQRHVIELQALAANVHYLRNAGHDISLSQIDIGGIVGRFHSALTDRKIEVPADHYSSETQRATVVPNRNMIFLSFALGEALSLSKEFGCNVDVGLGAHANDLSVYPDCREQFFEAAFVAFMIGNWDSEKVKMLIPFQTKTKAEIVGLAYQYCKKLLITPNIFFSQTHTCYNPNENGHACGQCGSCLERLEAFEKNGIKDPVNYQEQIR